MRELAIWIGVFFVLWVAIFRLMARWSKAQRSPSVKLTGIEPADKEQKLDG